MPVYFMSRALRGSEINYTPMEKPVLALLSGNRRLKTYFQAHTIVVITDQPIRQLLSNSKITRRMLKWKFELEGYDIQYLKKEENELRTYDKDEKLEEINSGGDQKIKGQHRSTSPKRHQLDKEASRRRHMTTTGGKSLAMNLKSSIDQCTRDIVHRQYHTRLGGLDDV
ncbi:reverse transcriptase domain-containing protein [Tanacetum coccineum]